MAVDNQRALEKAGFNFLNPSDIASATRFESAAESKDTPKTTAVLKAIGDSKLPDATKEAMITTLATRWKSDPEVFNKMEKDLNKDPKLANRIIQEATTNPQKMITALSQYNGSNINQLLPAAPVTPPAAPPKPADTVVTAAPATKPQQPARAKPPTAAPTTPEAAPIAAPAAPAVVTAAPAVSEPQTPSAPADNAPSAGQDGILAALSVASNDDIKIIMNDKNTKQVLSGLADKASSMGINQATVDGFKKATQDPKLQQAIARNLQNNPDFVRSMAKMAKDNGKLEEPFKSGVQREMNKLMENPQFLADEKYVKEMQQKMKMAEEFKNSGMMGMLSKCFDGMRGQMQGMFGQLAGIGAACSGPNPVFSMASGSGFLPSLMINMGNYNANMNEYLAGKNYSPNDMTALPPKGKDGKYRHDVEIKDDDGKPLMKDGKPLTKSVPNGTITVRTLDGKQIDVIPAVGSLVAKQDAQGNYRVPTIQDVDVNGAATKLAFVKMSPAEFEKLKKASDEAAVAQNYKGNYTTLAVDSGSIDTNSRAQKFARGEVDPIPVAKIDPASGAVTPTMVQPAQPAQAPVVLQAGVTTQIAHPNSGADNNPEYALRGNG